MHHLLAALLILALHLPGQASAPTLTCQVIPNRIGQPVCRPPRSFYSHHSPQEQHP